MKKFLLGAGLAATVSVGSVVLFTGDSTIEQVKTKVNGMLEMISKYEMNESQLSVKINDLKREKANLQQQIDNLTSSDSEKGNEIIDLQDRIAKLGEKITSLESQLKDKTDITKELENEIKRANAKVSELEYITKIEIEEQPMSEKEMQDALGNIIFEGTIYITAYESPDVREVMLTDYAKATITKVTTPEGNITFDIKIESTTDDGFNVVVGNDYGDRGDLCKQGQPFTYNIDPLSDNYENYIIIEEADKSIKYKVEASIR